MHPSSWSWPTDGPVVGTGHMAWHLWVNRFWTCERLDCFGNGLGLFFRREVAGALEYL